MRIFPGVVASLLLGVSIASHAAAQHVIKPVTFPSDATSASESGTLTGGETMTYSIDAKSGHSASVRLKSNHAQCSYVIYSPGQTPGRNAAMYDSAVSGNGFSGFLPSTGTYLVQIGLGREAALGRQTCDYTVTFAVAR
jgi:hypothetical protein